MADWANISWPASTAQPWTPDETAWSTNPDNFLSKKFAIPSSSSLVIGYVTNGRTYNGDILYPKAMEPLVGIGTGFIGSGGWWGFLQHGDGFGGWGLDQIQSLIWSENVPTNWSGGAGSASKCDPFGAISSGLSLGLGAAFLGMGTGGIGIAAMAAFFGAGAVGGIFSAASSGCFG